MTPNDIPEWAMNAAYQIRLACDQDEIIARIIASHAPDETERCIGRMWDRFRSLSASYSGNPPIEAIERFAQEAETFMRTEGSRSTVMYSGTPPINEQLLEACKDLMETALILPNGTPQGDVKILKALNKGKFAIADADSYRPRYEKLVQIARLVVGGCEEGTIIGALDAVDAAFHLAAPILEDIDAGLSAEAGTAKEEEKK